MITIYQRILFIFIIGLLCTACQPFNNKSSYMNSQQLYTLHFGPQGVQDFAHYTGGEVDRQPAGINFMELEWRSPELGRVKIAHGNNNLELDHVFLVMGSQMSRNANDSVQIITINAGLTHESFVTPKQAYDAYALLMKKLNQAGWQRYFYRSEVRIAKQDNFKYALNNLEVTDPSYIFTYEEWRELLDKKPIKNFYYRLYADGIILDMSLQRTEKAADNKEQYMVRYELKMVRYDERNIMEGDESEMTAAEIEQGFMNMVKDDKKFREADEKQEKLKGYRIDEEYIDPDVWTYVK